MTFLRNCWYQAAWDEEVVPGQPLGRQILGEHIVLFRREDGSPAALEDRCPHRFAPLSVGIQSGDSIACRYHGLAFDGSGACVVNPHGAIPRNAQVRSYPAHAAHRGVWIWMGDPALADPALIPDLSFLAEAPATAFSNGYLLCQSHYELGVDNIMDLSHTDFLHPDTLGGAGITETKPVIEQDGRCLEITWNTPGGRPSPTMSGMFPLDGAGTDVWQAVKWWPAGVMRLRVGAVRAGGRREDGFEFRNCHVMTPRTEKTTHYFFASTRNFRTDDGELNTRLGELRQRVFTAEDMPMIRMVQERMGDTPFWDLNPLLLTVDVAPVRVRRALRQLIAAEQAATNPMVSAAQ